MRYAIWNNKGGVGKSFLTFVFASEYASANPNKVVYVIDMCPPGECVGDVPRRQRRWRR